MFTGNNINRVRFGLGFVQGCKYSFCINVEGGQDGKHGAVVEVNIHTEISMDMFISCTGKTSLFNFICLFIYLKL